jgi:hypothetical protein
MKLSTREHFYESFGTLFYDAAVAVLKYGFDFLREFVLAICNAWPSLVICL